MTVSHLQHTHGDDSLTPTTHSQWWLSHTKNTLTVMTVSHLQHTHSDDSLTLYNTLTVMTVSHLQHTHSDDSLTPTTHT